MQSVRIGPVLFLISAVGIAYQVALMRIFSISQWHHFAYMVISMAMLGFGVSGTVLSLAGKRIGGKETAFFRGAVFLLAVSLVACVRAGQGIPFETFLLVSQPKQWTYLLGLYLLLAIPFFLLSTAIALGFLMHPDRVGRIYFFNMTGSGAGALAVAALLYPLSVEILPYVLTVPAAVAFLLACSSSRRTLVRALLPVVLLGLGLVGTWGHAELKVSEFKGLSYAMNLPDAKVLARTQSPLSRITAVGSALIRETPGQIGNYPMTEKGALPRQVGLYFDGGGPSVINAVDPETPLAEQASLAFLDYVNQAAAYRLVRAPRVLVVGPGGGTDVLAALWQGAREVTAVEVDPRVFALVRDRFGEFSGHLYDRDQVRTVVADGRGLMASDHNSYDLIQIALLDSFSAASAGARAISESYLYTREGVELYLSRLSGEGVLSITRWLKTPPRDAIKMFATLVEACEHLGIEDPSRHLVFLRSWNTGTLLVKRRPLTEEEIQSIRRFARERGFDLCYLPGLSREEANRFTVLKQPVYYDAARALLSGAREDFYREYLFHVRPATDDQPYFFRFFKWASLRRLLRGMGAEWVPFVEWGYLSLVITILQAALAGGVGILLPALAVKGLRSEGRVLGRVFTYFSALGLGYMFLELAFIQKFILFLAYPVYAVAVVLTSFLFFSGLGSLAADRLRRRRKTPLVALSVSGLAAGLAGYLFILPVVFEAAAGWGDAARIALSILLMAPPAFFMGFPFPCGLQWVSAHHRRLVPWAWAANGFFSVIGASLATLLAIHLGFNLLLGIAVLVYVVALRSLFRLEKDRTNGVR